MEKKDELLDSYPSDLELINSTLFIADEYNLQAEVLLSAMCALKGNPKLTINEALKDGLREWDIEIINMQ